MQFVNKSSYFLVPLFKPVNIFKALNKVFDTTYNSFVKCLNLTKFKNLANYISSFLTIVYINKNDLGHGLISYAYDFGGCQLNIFKTAQFHLEKP